MIPVWLALFLMATPCNSDVQQRAHETVASQCPMPEIQGPPPPPVKYDIPQPVMKKAKPVKKKKQRKRRRRR